MFDKFTHLPSGIDVQRAAYDQSSLVAIFCNQFNQVMTNSAPLRFTAIDDVMLALLGASGVWMALLTSRVGLTSLIPSAVELAFPSRRAIGKASVSAPELDRHLNSSPN
jgi:hypothetical protein